MLRSLLMRKNLEILNGLMVIPLLSNYCVKSNRKSVMATIKYNLSERRKSSVSSDRRSSVQLPHNNIMAALAAKKAASTLLGKMKDRRCTTAKGIN